MIQFNGEDCPWQEGMTIGSFLSGLNQGRPVREVLDGKILMVNDRIIRADAADELSLVDGDQIRVFRIPGGG
jgi:sulfur carrier protein ThiS